MKSVNIKVFNVRNEEVEFLKEVNQRIIFKCDDEEFMKIEYFVDRLVDVYIVNRESGVVRFVRGVLRDRCLNNSLMIELLDFIKYFHFDDCEFTDSEKEYIENTDYQTIMIVRKSEILKEKGEVERWGLSN